MHTEFEHRDQAIQVASRDARRTPWQQPVLKFVGASDAETGTNSDTDATATFS